MRSASLPEELQRFVDDRLGDRTTTDLRRSAGELSARYRAAAAAGPAARTDDDIAAYAATRLPATYAAVAVALDELVRVGFAPVSQLDLGTGLGSAVWAAGEAFAGSLRRVTAVDAVDRMLAMASAAAAASPVEAVRSAEWRRADVARLTPDEPVDLVTASYVLNELAAADALALLARVWERTTGALVLVEPGTPADYDRMMGFRAHLIERGATVLAPCPHDLPCPMRDDWCHFAVRLPRSAAHRAAKGAKRGFEDEKFTYVVAVRDAPPDRGVPRILRHPLVRPGHIRFRLCEPDGVLREQTVARSDPGYRTARKLSWGDRFEQ
jgi:ribosomal protein RSM22 (predicted rRNA methylase)